MLLPSQARRLRSWDPTPLFQRYFVNTLFDATFVGLGILAATALASDADVDFALGALFATSLAMGISTGVNVYEAEHTEGEIRMLHLERATLSSLKDTEVGREIRVARHATALVNFLAPLAVAGILPTPILIFRAASCRTSPWPPEPRGALGTGFLFGAGSFLGALMGRRPWRKAVRMSAVVLLTFGALIPLEGLLWGNVHGAVPRSVLQWANSSSLAWASTMRRA